jgi:Haem-binding domain
MIRKILVVLLIALIVIQFIRPGRNIGAIATPTDITHYVHVPDTVMHILQVSCYDCHSNNTVYPWYTNINPVGFWMWGHVKDGKRGINFSDLSTFNKRKLDHRLGDIAEQVEEKEMPLSSYTLIHTYATLDSGQVQIIKAWTEVARKEVGYQK